MLVCILIGIISSYGLLSYEVIGTNSFNLGLIFIVLGAITIWLVLVAVLGLVTHKLKKFWFIIGSAFLIQTISDFWYYVSENIYFYSYNEWYNIGWIIYIVLMMYAVRYSNTIFYNK